jgi:hypothetical protein
LTSIPSGVVHTWLEHPSTDDALNAIFAPEAAHQGLHFAVPPKADRRVPIATSALGRGIGFFTARLGPEH